MPVQSQGRPPTTDRSSLPPRSRGRSPRPRTNIPPQVRDPVSTKGPPSAYKVMYAKNPSAADVAALAGHRIAEVSPDDPRRTIAIGLLAIIRTYLLTMDAEQIARRSILTTPFGRKPMDLETRIRLSVLTFRDLIGAVSRHAIPAQNFLSRSRPVLDDAKAFRLAVERVTGAQLLHEHENGEDDDMNFKLGRDHILEVYPEPDLTALDAK